ncbi:MMPL family transporter [Kushneria indalinina]|uniref:Putative exporter n=1 Tax=Kushneria indalinina DSM 14324 TaxID=1122140 RepID=A0A3D9DTR6_9GAMM|nr:MMPL family transporter [Kushneria indalinina]REC94180.1 putative exporter [Kushneria indalinina DSM 14324]
MMRATRLPALLWLMVLTACLAFSSVQLLRGASLDTRITALLPETHQSPGVDRANDQLSAPFTHRFVLLLEAEQPNEASGALAQTLEDADVVSELRYRPGDYQLDNLLEVLGPSRYRLLGENLRATIDSGDTDDLRRQALASLIMPTGLDQHPVRDPFGLLDRWLDSQLSTRFDTRGDLVTLEVDGRSLVVMTATLSGNAWDTGLQDRLTDAINDFQGAHPDAQLWRSGMVFHAADGAHQAKSEISTIGLGSLIGVLLILLVVFRSPVTIATLLLPLVAGGVFALAITLWWFQGIHLLTIAFGSSLIGVAIDYALHLQCARTLAGREFRLRRMLPGLALGLVTSVMAYVVQAFTPMPGLRQMAIFAGCGLVGAWLTVVLWLPLTRVHTTPGTRALAERLWGVLDRLRGRLGPRLALVLALVAISIAGVRLQGDDSLRLINTSSQQLLGDEALVQRELGRDTGTVYLLVMAHDTEGFLGRVESLNPLLESLMQEGHLGGYTSLAERVPSRSRQSTNLERTRTLYQQQLDQVYASAGLPPALYERALEALEQSPPLTLDHWLASPLGESDQRLWLGEIDRGQVGGMITLNGGIDDRARQQLASLARSDENIELVDRVEQISAVLGELRRQIAQWVAGALVALTLLLALRYRWRTWRVIAPAGGAILTVLTLYALLGVPLNLFHQLALLLVLGIGLDAGIFMQEHPRAHHAWLAITLSIISSLLAFGLLAFSATPVLHHIGMTTLIGLASVWLLTALVQHRLPPDQTTPHDNAHDHG